MACLSDSTDPTDSDHMPSLELDQTLNASIEIEDSRRLDLVGTYHWPMPMPMPFG